MSSSLSYAFMNIKHTRFIVWSEVPKQILRNDFFQEFVDKSLLQGNEKLLRETTKHKPTKPAGTSEEVSQNVMPSFRNTLGCVPTPHEARQVWTKTSGQY